MASLSDKFKLLDAIAANAKKAKTQLIEVANTESILSDDMAAMTDILYVDENLRDELKEKKRVAAEAAIKKKQLSDEKKRKHKDVASSSNKKRKSPSKSPSKSPPKNSGGRPGVA